VNISSSNTGKVRIDGMYAEKVLKMIYGLEIAKRAKPY